ncbi:Ulp1 protease family [Vigna unguiculata]|uniref:Ulp1 protease family n=1 Tax=Vigna unguiculata TaxID=3917 RepID=A0A4D6NKH1_VIGUN|nr:Ulp1 protease family [Vigna unguiculata]
MEELLFSSRSRERTSREWFGLLDAVGSPEIGGYRLAHCLATVLLSAEFLFAPIVHDDHWWCYCVNLKTMEFFVFDSLGHNRKNRTRIYNYIARNMELFLSMLLNCESDKKPSFNVQSVDTPIQPNGRCCN